MQVRFTPSGKNGRGSTTYRASFEEVPPKPQHKAVDMLKLHPGVRGYEPRGVDRNAPKR